MLENYTFLPFSVFLAIFWVFTYKKVPETKNKTFDEIATLFKIQNKQKYVLPDKFIFPNLCTKGPWLTVSTISLKSTTIVFP